MVAPPSGAWGWGSPALEWAQRTVQETMVTHGESAMWMGRAVLGLVAVLSSVVWAEEAVRPLARAHAHNDYLHERPLDDALDNGFCSVEADINLVDGALLVAHSPEETSPERTLEALYLEPLRTRVRAKDGAVYPGARFWLLIDIKTEGRSTYEALHATLERYADILTVYRDGQAEPGAVDVLVDGADAFIAAQSVRYASIDGRPKDLDTNPPATLVPWISESWKALFAWNGVGPMAEAEKAKLRDIVERAHEQGRKVRFWGLPMRTAAVWEALYAAEVDLINADNLAGLREFLAAKER